MTRDEYFESVYLLDDVEYVKRFCFDDAEAYSIERDLQYNDNCWLFEKPVNYGLEDDYGEESEP
nr:hypothetical protein [Catenibacterium mitsuokai]